MAKDKKLVEASPYDKVWGIAMSVDDPDILDETKWRGENLLGMILTQVREVIKLDILEGNHCAGKYSAKE